MQEPRDTHLRRSPAGGPTKNGRARAKRNSGKRNSGARSDQGHARTITRNKRGLPQRITDQRFGVAVFDEQYGWDPNGNLQMQDDALNLAGGDRALNYDARDRLTSSWISGYGNESFGWDAFDRLRWRNTWSGAETFNYDGTHRLTSINGPSGTRWYGHDARGNTTIRPGFSHSFDALNRLTQTTMASPAGTEQYDYDPHGRRTLTRRPNGTVTVDYYSRDGLVRGRADTALGGTTVYIHLGNTLVAEDARAWRRSFGLRYLHTDVIGTPIAKTDEAGSVIERDRRQSFGQPFAGSLQNGLGFTGHMEDPGTGLVYMQQRYYDPAIARFLSVDPVGPLADPSNHFGRYHYALNNPYKYTDPDGRVANFAIGFAIGFVVDAGIQYARTGQVDVKQSLVSGAAGALTGGIGGALTKAAAGGTISATTATTGTAAAGAVAGGLATAATATVTGQALTTTQLVVGTVVGATTSGVAAAGTNAGVATAGTLNRMANAPVNSPAGIGLHIASATGAAASGGTSATAQGAAAGARDVATEAAGKVTESAINRAVDERRPQR